MTFLKHVKEKMSAETAEQKATRLANEANANIWYNKFYSNLKNVWTSVYNVITFNPDTFFAALGFMLIDFVYFVFMAIAMHLRIPYLGKLVRMFTVGAHEATKMHFTLQHREMT